MAVTTSFSCCSIGGQFLGVEEHASLLALDSLRLSRWSERGAPLLCLGTQKSLGKPDQQ